MSSTREGGVIDSARHRQEGVNDKEGEGTHKTFWLGRASSSLPNQKFWVGTKKKKKKKKKSEELARIQWVEKSIRATHNKITEKFCLHSTLFEKN